VGERALREALRRLPNTRALADGRLTSIVGGLSNFAWRLDHAGSAWFLRQAHADAERLGVNRASECRLLDIVAQAGLAPEMLACDPATGLLVTRFVEGGAWQVTDATDERNLLRLARLLESLHELPVPAGVHEVSFARQARELSAGEDSKDEVASTLAVCARRAFARIEARPSHLTLCHNDLHHLNILDDGERLWLVDWEYGGRGDPLFDVAGFLALHGLDARSSTIFVDAYARLRAHDLAVLDEARWAFDYVQWLWYRRRYAGLPVPADDPTGRLAQRLLHCDNP
jgi:thiamine kinase